MNTLEAIQARRSVKHYDPDHQMSEEEIMQLLGLAMLSPTAFNIQNWRFVTVRDPELRKQIRAVSWDQAQVTDASLLIVLCADLKAWEKDPGRYWRNAPQEVADFLVPAIGDYYRDKPQVMQDELRDALRGDGRLLIIDFDTHRGWRRPSGIPESRDGHGISKEMLVSEMEGAGFVLIDDMKWPNGDYALVFQVAVID